MDHRAYSDQADLNQEPTDAENGASYLRKLKDADTSEEGTTEAPAASAPAVECSPTGKERRRSLRYRCSGSAEFRAEGSDVRMWGTLTDISLHGCYVEMTTTFPVDSRVELTLDAVGIRVRLAGTVRVSYPFLGMGISFSEIEPGQQQQLEQMLFALAGQASLPNEAGIAADKTVTALSVAAAAADPSIVLDQVRSFFMENRLLSREEFLLIARRAARS